MAEYALVQSGAIVRFGLPPSARRLDDGKWVLGLADAPEALKAACGYLPVVDVARPADTATHTFDRSVVLSAGVPTVVWTQRPLSVPELSERAAATNSVTIRDQARLALEANATYLAVASPTNAQVVAQVRSLTRQINGLIRLEVNALDATT